MISCRFNEKFTLFFDQIRSHVTVFLAIKENTNNSKRKIPRLRSTREVEMKNSSGFLINVMHHLYLESLNYVQSGGFYYTVLLLYLYPSTSISMYSSIAFKFTPLKKYENSFAHFANH